MRSTFGASDCSLLSINSSLDAPIKHQDNPWASQVSLFVDLVICYFLFLFLMKNRLFASSSWPRAYFKLPFGTCVRANFFHLCENMQLMHLSPETCDRHVMPHLIKILVAFLTSTISMRFFSQQRFDLIYRIYV